MNKNYKNTKTKRILDLLKHRALTAKEIIESIVPISADSYKVTKNLLGYMEAPKFNHGEWQRQETKKFYVLLSKMRRDNLIDKEEERGGLWKLTKTGADRLDYILKCQSVNNLPDGNYEKEKSGELTLVVFDIPEKFKHKRIWLRERLRDLGFQMLQRSVWIGKYKIPESFIYDLRDLKILDYIHILAVRKSGSLVNLGI